MIDNAIEICRVVVMIGPLVVWPVVTMVLHEKSKKEKQS